MDDRHDAPDRATGLSDTLDDEVVAYRPLNVMAVVGTALALASPLALASRWFAMLPVAGLVFSAVAARRVQRNPDATSGYGLAAFGLALSLVVLTAVLVQAPLAQRMHAASVGAFADEFVDRLARGDLEGAHQLTEPYAVRRATPELAAAYYRDDAQAKTELEGFAARDDVARVGALGGKAPRRLQIGETYRRSASRFNSEVGYQLPPTASEDAGLLVVRLERAVTSRLGRVAWRVVDFEVVDLKR